MSTTRVGIVGRAVSGRARGLVGVIGLSVALLLVAPATAAAEREAEPPQFIELPKLIGMTLPQAKAALAKLGHRGSVWEIANTKCADRPKVKEGQICYQYPKPGKEVGLRSPIKVLIKGAWKQEPAKPKK